MDSSNPMFRVIFPDRIGHVFSAIQTFFVDNFNSSIFRDKIHDSPKESILSLVVSPVFLKFSKAASKLNLGSISGLTVNLSCFFSH